MARINRECIEAAASALKNFSHEEVSQYVREVLAKSNDYKGVSKSAAIDNAMRDIGKEHMASYISDARIKSEDMQKYNELAAVMRDKKIDVRSVYTARGNYQGSTVVKSQRHVLEEFHRDFVGQMSFEEMKLFSEGKINDSIVDAYDGAKIDSVEANKVAKVFHEYMEAREAHMLQSGAMSKNEINGDRYFRSCHDPQRLLTAAKSLTKLAADGKKYNGENNFTAWKNYIIPLLDLNKTFRHTDAMGADGKVDMAIAHGILEDIYSNIVNGKSDIFSRYTSIKDADVARNKRHMFFYFKNMKSQYKYNQVFGRGNLVDMFLRDIQSTADKVGAARILGSNPDLMFNELKKVQLDMVKKGEVAQKGGRFWRNTDIIRKQVMGENGSIDPSFSNFMSNWRAVGSMARLGLTAIKSISDVSYVAAFAHRIGIGYFETYTHAMSHMFNAIPTEERKYIASLFKTNVDSHLGFMGKWADVNNSSDVIRKISHQFFKVNLLEGLDRGNKLSIMTMMSKRLGDVGHQSFAELNPKLQKWVGKFLSPEEWELLRGKSQSSLFTTDNVNALTQDELKSLQREGTPLYRMRDDLSRKVHSMFQVASENAVLQPAEFEQAFLYQGLPPGSLGGELLRALMQFKSYTAAFIDRVLVQGFRDADTLSQKATYASALFVGALPLTVLQKYLADVIEGREQKSWDEMSPAERIRTGIEYIVPGLALFSGLLDSSHAKNKKDLVINLLGGPQTALVGHALASPLAALMGDGDEAIKELGRAAEYLAPVTPFKNAAKMIENAMGDQAQLSPF